MYDYSTLIVPILTIIGSFAGAWLAARLALRRFYKEKVWERKTAAYTAVFESLHDMNLVARKHVQARINDPALSYNYSIGLVEEYRAARDTLERKISGQTWILPDRFRARIDVLFTELDQTTFTTADELLVHDKEVMEKAQVDLRALVKTDLKV